MNWWSIGNRFNIFVCYIIHLWCYLRKIASRNCRVESSLFWQQQSETEIVTWHFWAMVLSPDQTRTQVFRKLACDDFRCHRSTSAQVVASSELPLGIRHVELQFLWRRAGKCGKDLHWLVFCVQTTRKLKKNLRCNLNMLKLVASHRKLAFKRGTSKHKQKLAMTCVLVWSGLNKAKTADEYDDMFMSGYISIVCLNRRMNRRLNVECTSQWYMIMALRILQYAQKPK